MCELGQRRWPALGPSCSLRTHSGTIGSAGARGNHNNHQPTVRLNNPTTACYYNSAAGHHNARSRTIRNRAVILDVKNRCIDDASSQTREKQEPGG